VRALRLRGRFRRPFAFTHSSMTWRRVRESFLLAGRKASGDTRRLAARVVSGCFFGLTRDSVLPCHLRCIQTRGTYGVSTRTKKNKEGEEREGGDGCDPTLKNMGALMPAAKSHCWRQNLKVVARRTQTPPQDEEQWRCTCAHSERGEAEEGQGQRVCR
jgi:hypothetical protein